MEGSREVPVQRSAEELIQAYYAGDPLALGGFRRLFDPGVYGYFRKYERLLRVSPLFLLDQTFEEVAATKERTGRRFDSSLGAIDGWVGAFARDNLHACLIESYYLGCDPAYDVLYRHWSSVLSGRFRKDVSSAADVEDLVDEVLMRVAGTRKKRGGQYRRADGPFAPWIKKIASNVLNSHLRHMHGALDGRLVSPAARVTWDDLADSPHTKASPQVNWLRPVENAVESGEIIETAIKSFPMLVRKAFGTPSTQLADEQNETPNAINVRATRQRQALRKLLGLRTED